MHTTNKGWSKLDTKAEGGSRRMGRHLRMAVVLVVALLTIFAKDL